MTYFINLLETFDILCQETSILCDGSQFRVLRGFCYCKNHSRYHLRRDRQSRVWIEPLSWKSQILTPLACNAHSDFSAQRKRVSLIVYLTCFLFLCLSFSLCLFVLSLFSFVHWLQLAPRPRLLLASGA